MSPEEKIEAAEKLIAEARAEFAAKKRNWPEKIEAGMVFGESNGSANAWFVAGVGFACISGSYLGMWRETLPTGCRYIGKDCVSICPSAHEPTGAELVGRYCEYCDTDGDWDNWEEGVCEDFTPGADQPYLRNQDVRFRFARLAR